MSLVEKEEYETAIRNWIIFEKQLKTINEKVKQWKEMKANLSTTILQFIERNEMDGIETNEGRLCCVQKKEYTPLTYGYLEKSLESIVQDKSKVQQIISFLKNNREIKTTHELIWKER